MTSEAKPTDWAQAHYGRVLVIRTEGYPQQQQLWGIVKSYRKGWDIVGAVPSSGWPRGQGKAGPGGLRFAAAFTLLILHMGASVAQGCAAL